MNIEKYIKEAGENVNYDCPECKGKGRCHQKNPDCGSCLVGECDGGTGEYCYIPSKCDPCNGTGKAPLNISDMLCDIIEALMDARRAHKEGRFADWKSYNMMLKQYNNIHPFHYKAFEEDLKDSFEDKIADAFIRIFEIYTYLKLEYTPDPTLSIDCYGNVAEQLLEFSGIIYRLKNRILYGMKETANFLCSELIQYLEYFCNKNNIPIEKHIEAKLKYNRANK